MPAAKILNEKPKLPRGRRANPPPVRLLRFPKLKYLLDAHAGEDAVYVLEVVIQGEAVVQLFLG